MASSACNASAFARMASTAYREHRGGEACFTNAYVEGSP